MNDPLLVLVEAGLCILQSNQQIPDWPLQDLILEHFRKEISVETPSCRMPSPCIWQKNVEDFDIQAQVT